jgi:acetate kinase
MVGSILTLNAGSSSLKFAIFDGTATGLKARVRGEIEDLDAAPHLLARDTDGSVLAERRWPTGTTLPFAVALDTLLECNRCADATGGGCSVTMPG